MKKFEHENRIMERTFKMRTEEKVRSTINYNKITEAIKNDKRRRNGRGSEQNTKGESL